MMGRTIAVAVLLVVTMGLSGCLSGAIYTHTTVPLDVNLEGAPAHPGHRGGSWKTLVIPLYVANPRFDWGSTAIGDALEQADLDTAYYADLETFSVLGIWTQRTIHVYGR